MWEVRNRDTVNALRSSQADIVYPYNGIVYQTSDILRRYYLNTKDIKVLYKKLIGFILFEISQYMEVTYL